MFVWPKDFILTIVWHSFVVCELIFIVCELIFIVCELIFIICKLIFNHLRNFSFIGIYLLSGGGEIFIGAGYISSEFIGVSTDYRSLYYK